MMNAMFPDTVIKEKASKNPLKIIDLSINFTKF